MNTFYRDPFVADPPKQDDIVITTRVSVFHDTCLSCGNDVLTTCARPMFPFCSDVCRWRMYKAVKAEDRP